MTKKQATAAIAAESASPIRYDAQAVQTIPFELTQRGRVFKLSHTLKPLEAGRFFQFEAEQETVTARAKKLSTEIYTPKHKLWKDTVESVSGYKERDDWRESVHQSDAIAVMNALLHVNIADEAQEAAAADGELFDADELTVIEFAAMFNGTLLADLSHSFRPETKAEMDEFLALETGGTNPNALASAVKKSKVERLCELGAKILVETSGYADGSVVPPWHLAVTTESFFIRQIARMGKF